MSTLTAPLRPEEKDSGRVILHDVPWDVYVSLRDKDANRHLRMAYYQGTLELMSPRYRHEKYSRALDRLVWELVVELGIPCTAPVRRPSAARAERPAKNRIPVSTSPTSR